MEGTQGCIPMKVLEKIRAAQSSGLPFFSLEFFPPKTASAVAQLYDRLESMLRLEPAFVDMTWGAGGSTAKLSIEMTSAAPLCPSPT